MSLRVTIVELKEAMCRWPLGDPASSEFRYCGSPRSGPYCAYHGGSPTSRRTIAAATAIASRALPR